MINNHKLKSGFTLVELSIVLVIIGLLTAGVVGGQSLVESAKIQSQATQLRGYETAIAAFKLEYDQLPGDFNYADALTYGFVNGQETAAGCNGDGNLYNITAWPESYYAFIQLAAAKLINDPQKYKNSSYSVGAGEPFPADKIGRGGVALTSKADGKLYFFLGPTLKNDTTTANSHFYNINSASPSFTPKEASKIDKKIDDGIPNSGAVRAVVVTNNASTNFGDQTATGTTECLTTTSTYNVSYNTPACRLLIKVSTN